MSVTRVEAVGNIELGEGPHWDVPSQSLYYVDIFGKAIHKYTPSTGHHASAKIDGPATLIVPIDGTTNEFAVSSGRKVLRVVWDGNCSDAVVKEVLAEVDTGDVVKTNRINDGKCDPSGRLWFGTMGEEPVNGQIAENRGSFFSLSANKVLKTHISPVWISNGLAWSGKKFYYIDSPKLTIDEYEYDEAAESIINCKSIFSLKKHDITGVPDGMCIDTDGNLWIAIFNGFRVIKIDPRKPETLLQTIEIPAKQVTSVAFGGANLDELYVTTAGFTVNGVDLPAPNHGALYKVSGLGAKGYPGVAFKL